jgi:large subunit ribosomal protein L17
MRHRKKTIKLGRTSAHRDALLASLVCNLIAEKRIVTTLPKAKAARSLAEKMVTLGKRGTLADRRRAISRLHRKERVAILFDEISPEYADRPGGYTRIVKIGNRGGDNSEMAILEWVEGAVKPSSSDSSTETKAASAE